MREIWTWRKQDRPAAQLSKGRERQCERNQNRKRLRNDTSQPVSAPGDCRSGMERTVSKQASEVTQLHQTIDRMARILEAHVAQQEEQ